jgi:isocitrate dehydrogenase (NAD+)
MRTALNETWNVDKIRTGDLGGKATTAEFTKALVSRIANA